MLLSPILPQAIHTQIAALVQESFALKKQSQHLLQVVKQAVEIAIEQTEEAAMAFIEREI